MEESMDNVNLEPLPLSEVQELEAVHIEHEEIEHEERMIDEIQRTPYELEWIEINPPDTLLIDEYQRPFSPTDVNRIVQEYNPSLLGVITINVRSSDRNAHSKNDGKRYIVDGQHRVLAQRRRGENRMFAMVFTGLVFEQEAWLFHELNDRRRALSPGAKFKARVLAGDRVAQEVRNMASQFGFRLSYGPTKMDGHTIMAVGSLERIWRDSPSELRKVLVFIKEVWPNDPDSLRYSIIEGTWRFLKLYGNEVDLANAKEKLRMLTAHTMIAKAMDYKRSLGGVVPATLAEVMLIEYNRSKRMGQVKSKYRG